MAEIEESPGRTDGLDKQRERLFAHGIHEEGVFYNRLNFFLLFETVLLAGELSALNGKDVPPCLLTIPVSLFGILVSLVWWYAQTRKLALLQTLGDRLEREFDEFKETIRLAKARRPLDIGCASAIIAWGLPLAFVACWLYLIVYSVCPRK